LVVEGLLEFARNVSTRLNVHSAKIWGTVEIGTADDPIPPEVNATVALYGEETDQTVIMVEGLFMVNKVFGVLGTLTAFGSDINCTLWAKLYATVEAGAQELVLRGNVSEWPAGAEIGISAT
jgi:hypothetical protein